MDGEPILDNHTNQESWFSNRAAREKHYDTIVSQYVQENPIKASLLHYEYDTSEKQTKVYTDQGLCLNDLLPKEFKIHNTSWGTYQINGFNVYMDLERITRLGTAGSVIVAHEFGHILAPESELDKFEERVDRLTQTRGVDMNQQFHNAIELFNGVIKDEIDGWNYGKQIATILGVDEIQYEDLMQFALQTYYYDYLGDIVDLSRRVNFADDHTMNIFDISTQEEVTIDYSTFKNYLKAIEKTNHEDKQTAGRKPVKKISIKDIVTKNLETARKNYTAIFKNVK